jgi:aryl-alcohol dehydrogenase-like predicted oxidoreductase
LEPSSGEALAEAHDEGVGTIIKESVANGRLTQRDLQTTAPLREAFPEDSPDTIAVAAILAQPWVDTVLSGAATIEQLESNLDALNVDPARVLGIETMMAEDPVAYWKTRSGLKWT